ncbi:MAG: hypothetical protein B5M53_09590 [Candidatus Cloacimonas sp. 4484_209]|nr:MAG: hypothetical protein B5M53_09590 [Candidatus Cloacimonas sp. 4484_209]
MYQRDEEKVQTYRSKLSSIENEVTTLKKRYLFEEIFNAVSTIEKNLTTLDKQLKTIRQKGFIYGKDWEQLISDFKNELPGIKKNIQKESDSIANIHSFTLDKITSEIDSIRLDFEKTPGAYYSYIDSVESKIFPIKEFVSEAETKLKTMIQPIEERIGVLISKVNRINNGFEHLEKATFKLLEGENLVDVWDAQYFKEGKKGPKGFIFLTDKRFRFEQDENVVVSRKFLVVAKREHRQNLLIDEPIGLIISSKDSEKGFFLAKKEMLNLEFGQGAKVRKAIFRTTIDSKEVDDIIDSVISGGIASTMVPEAGKKAEKPLPKIDRCPACGAMLTTPIVKGMTYIKCEYCGKIIYL